MKDVMFNLHLAVRLLAAPAEILCRKCQGFAGDPYSRIPHLPLQDIPEGPKKLVWRMVRLGMEVGYNPPQSSYFQLFKAPKRR